MKVLIVDDSAPDRKLLGYYFKREGWETVEAENGRKAVSIIRREVPDLIVSDALMPEMDGFQLLRELKKMQLFPHIPFIVYSSSYTGEKDRELGLSLGADAYVTKGKGPDEFWQEVNRVLKSARRLDAPQEVIDEEQYLSKYSNVLIHKLEQKIEELEHAKAHMEETEKRLEQDIEQRRILMAQVHHLNEELERRNVLQESRDVRTRQELERLSPTFFEDMLVPLREIERLCGYFSSGRQGNTHVCDNVNGIADRFGALLAELLNQPKIPRVRLHEPLRSLRICVETVLRDEEDNKDLAARLRRETDRMEYLVDDLLDLVRVIRIEMNNKDLDMADLLRETEVELRNVNPDRKVDFALPQSVPVTADPDLLRIAIEKLLENAWIYTAETSKPRIEFGIDGSRGQTFFIRDNGVGFDQARAGEIFVPFKRLHDDRFSIGSGIGLAIAKVVIERHGGSIRAAGSPGEGAVFRFTIP